tara:strand:- start:1280 stop:1930 length:651 start_codon:yes stop_codon:yes gene_type:complete
MNTSQIFKLIFKHDLRLNELSEENTSSTNNKPEASVLDFMKPDPTFSKLHFSGSNLEAEQFGLDTLSNYATLVSAIQKGLDSHTFITGESIHNTLDAAIQSIEVGERFVVPTHNISEENPEIIETISNLELKSLLEQEYLVFYKAPARNGFDLFLFSKKNIYRDLFPHLQKLVPTAFRFFSINGKKFNTERHFYFETWTLSQPPHGFEEVFPETIL